MAEGQGRGPASFLPRDLHVIRATELRLADLTAEGALESVGLSLGLIRADDWSPCQMVGQAAHYLGLQGILAPSATDLGFVIAAFEPALKRGQLVVEETRPLVY